MWEITRASQLINSATGFIIGIMFSVVHSIFKPLTNKIKDKLFIVLLDISSFVFMAIVDFFVFYALTNGEIRFYIIFFEIIGFWLFDFLLSRAVYIMFEWIFGVFSMFFNFIFYLLQKICEKTLVFLYKTSKILKKLLKSVGVMLYTIFNKHNLEKK